MSAGGRGILGLFSVRFVWRTVELVLTAVVVAAALPLWLLPRGAAVSLGRLYGLVAFVGWPRARRVAMINLRRALDLERRAARAMTARVLSELGASVAEGVHFARRYRGSDASWQEAYRPEDAELERRILADPRPKVFVTAHLGSWEAGAMILARRFGERGAFIVRRVDNPFLDRVVRWLRLERDSQWLEKRGGAGEALSRLRGGQSVGMLLDEDAGSRGIFVEFFGRAASTQKTAALLSLMTDAPVVVGALVRCPGAVPVYRLRQLEPAAYERSDEGGCRLTQDVTRILEEWIRDAPAQWRWIHWRWRQRPDGSREGYGRRDLRACFASPSRMAAGAEDAGSVGGLEGASAGSARR